MVHSHPTLNTPAGARHEGLQLGLGADERCMSVWLSGPHGPLSQVDMYGLIAISLLDW